MRGDAAKYKNYPLKFKALDTTWPAFARPKEDELLSSLLYRNATNHFYKPHSFCHLIWPGQPIWNRDIDRCASSSITDTVSCKTNSSIDQISKTLLTSYMPNLFLNHQIKGITKWIMPLGVYHRTRRNFGLMMCPSCFQKKELLYFKKQWRLSFIVACNRCKVILVDRCSKCGTGINFFRSGFGNNIDFFTNQMAFCFNCKFDFRDSILVNANSSVLDYQTYLYNSVETGYNDISRYSHLYFEGLSAIILMILSKEKRVSPFRNFIISSYDLRLITQSENQNFDYLPVLDRYQIMLIVADLMKSWPDIFIETCKKARVYSAAMLKDKANFPYWYYKVVRENFLMNIIQPKF